MADGWNGSRQNQEAASPREIQLKIIRKSFLAEVKDGATGVCGLKEVSCLQGTKQQVSWTLFQGQESPPWKICEKQSHTASCFFC